MPGHPDIVLKKHKTTVFVHGCFWHRHKNCERASTPTTNRDYWLPKFERTVARDKTILREVRRLGWRAVVVWECELRNPEKLIRRILRIVL
jgi:DNA mismatch endonuclease (patch repair protein)